MSADKTPSDIAHDIAETLQGTCGSLTAALDQIDREDLENNSEFCATLDQLIFCCDGCGWWCEQSEMSEKVDWHCDDCEPGDSDE